MVTQSERSAATRADVTAALRGKAAAALVLAECIGSRHDLAVCVPLIQRSIEADTAYDHLALDLGAVVLADSYGPATALMRALDRVTAMARTLSLTQARAILVLARQGNDALEAREAAGQSVTAEERGIMRRGLGLATAFVRFRGDIERLDDGGAEE